MHKLALANITLYVHPETVIVRSSGHYTQYCTVVLSDPRSDTIRHDSTQSLLLDKDDIRCLKGSLSFVSVLNLRQLTIFLCRNRASESQTRLKAYATMLAE